MRDFPGRRMLLSALVLVLASCGDGSVTPVREVVLVKLSGDGGTGVVGAMLGSAPSLAVRDGSGAAVAGVEVIFTVTGGGGATADFLVLTNSSGVASTDWYLGVGDGVNNRLRASVVADGYSAESVEFVAMSTMPTIGVSYFGAAGYIEYLPGDLPIIISAPHGGAVVPPEIPARTAPGITTARDSNTEELARAIQAEFLSRTGHRPHVIICRLHRTRLDANREIVEAAGGNRLAERAWYEWHSFIRAARHRVAADYPGGLYMDLHGHGHNIPRLELGYLLLSSELGFNDVILGGDAFLSRSSLRSLITSSGTPLPQLVRGEYSLGTLFEAAGYPAVPSASQPNPGTDDYFSGGYNTDLYGSRMGGTISGFQLESHFPGVRDTQNNRADFAAALVDVFDTFLMRHFGIDITS